MTMLSAPATFPRSTDADLFPSLAFKLHCMLEQGAITTYTKDGSIAGEIALESVSRHGDAVEESYDGCA